MSVFIDDKCNYWGEIHLCDSEEIIKLSKDYISVGTESDNDLVIITPDNSHLKFSLCRDPENSIWINNLSESRLCLNGELIDVSDTMVKSGHRVSLSSTEQTTLTDILYVHLANKLNTSNANVKTEDIIIFPEGSTNFSSFPTPEETGDISSTSTNIVCVDGATSFSNTSQFFSSDKRKDISEEGLISSNVLYNNLPDVPTSNPPGISIDATFTAVADELTQKDIDYNRAEKVKYRNFSPENSSKKKRQCLSKHSSPDLNDLLTCSICSEVMFECMSIQPCLHNFCHLCLLQWQIISNECPLCRENIKKCQKNHTLNGIIDEFLKYNEGLQKSQEQKINIWKEIDEYNLKLQEKKSSPTIVNDYSSDDGSDSDNSTEFVRDPRRSQPIQTCISCQWESPCHEHIICACCTRLMPSPDAARLREFQNTTCPLCHRSFCAFLSLCLCGNTNCVSSLSDSRLPLQDPLFLRNATESTLLLVYLSKRQISHDQFLAVLLEDISQLTMHQFEDGLDETALTDITLDTKVCRACIKACFSRLVYAWRSRLSTDHVDRYWPKRPNCHYGRNCRTQRNNIAHSAKYNHCCEQTRFI